MSIRSFLTTLSAVALLTQPVHAAEPCTVPTQTPTAPYSTHIQLSEIYPTPNDDEEEFIELYNAGKKSVDLAGWILEDASGKKYVIKSDDVVSSVVGAGGYWSVPWSTTKIYLNNSSDTVKLYQPDDTLLDEQSYEKSSTGSAWTRVDSKWVWSTTSTPGKKNVLTVAEKDEDASASDTSDASTDTNTNSDKATNYQTSDDVHLNEIMPAPISGDEWIELYNVGSTVVALNGWQLSDGVRTYTVENALIAPAEYLVFTQTETGIALNNSGDSVTLIDPYDAQKDAVTYEGGAAGSSYARNENQWVWTDVPTQGAANSIVADTPSDSEDDDEQTEVATNATHTIAELRALPEDSEATITGIVTVLPDVFGSQYFYMQDDTAGIQVYSYNKYFPELMAGTRVEVHGTTSLNRGELRIKTTVAEDIVALGQETEAAPLEVTELTEAEEGRLVRVTSLLLNATSTTLELENGMSVKIKTGAGITTSSLPEGKTVTVTGIVGEYDGSYSLYPRSMNDITVEEAGIELISAASAAELPNAQTPPATIQGAAGAQQTGVLLLLLILAGGTIGAAIWYQKKKTDSTPTTEKNDQKIDPVLPRKRLLQ